MPENDSPPSSFRLIAHRVSKEANSTAVSHKTRDDLLPAVDQLSQDLVQQIRRAFSDQNPVSGAFRRTADDATVRPEFEQLLTNYLKKRTDKAFIRFSKDATNLLVKEIGKRIAAKGGYLVFAEYEAPGGSFLLVSILGSSGKPRFDEEINLTKEVILDLDHIRHAGRVRYDRAADNDDGVVVFISPKREAASQYFVDFLGCEELERSQDRAKHLYQGLLGWSKDQKHTPERSVQIREAAYDYWKECSENGEPMTITGLANRIEPNAPKKLVQFLSDEALNIAGEFPPPRSSDMKRFKQFSYSGEGLKLVFDRNTWLGKITVKKGSITITDPPQDLVEQLKTE